MVSYLKKVFLKFKGLALNSQIHADRDHKYVSEPLFLCGLNVFTFFSFNDSFLQQCQLDVKKVLGEYFKLLSKAKNNPDMLVLMIGKCDAVVVSTLKIDFSIVCL